MAKTSISSNEWAKNGFKDYVVEEFVSAPFTQIQNRASVSNTLKPLLGVERVMLNTINLLQKEFGPNGEQVYEADNKDARFRFVGNGWLSQFSANGNPINDNPSQTTDFVEVTFYGTGLNWLTSLGNASRDVRVTIDGGAESGNVRPANEGAVLEGRNYKANQIITVASGLALGWHTVKLRTNATSNNHMYYGFEIINDRANIAFAPGNAFSGQTKEYLSALTASAYNSSVTGSKGARVVKYIKDGAISEAVTLTDASQGNLTSANHANEEVIRKINWREFGANRGDDFSTISGTGGVNRAYTLDDGTTTLFGSAVSESTDLQFNGTGSFIIFTFVGTGLDLERFDFSNPVELHSVTIDGVNIGNLTNLGATSIPYVSKVVSGLPYGTHSVKIVRTNTSQSSTAIKNFIIYGPKKPTLPAGAVELCDYNVMADYVTNTSTASGAQYFLSQGVIAKSCTREILYNSGGTLGIEAGNTGIGMGWILSGTSMILQYSFFGTGFEFDARNDGTAVTWAVQVDGSNYTGAATTVGAGTSWVAGTSTFTPGGNGGSTVSDPSKLIVNGLSLGLHTVKFTCGGTGAARFRQFNIITPVHINGEGSKAGSLSLKDSRYTKPLPVAPQNMDLSKAKAWVLYDKANGKILASYNVSSVVNVATGRILVIWQRPFKTPNYVAVATPVRRQFPIGSGGANYFATIPSQTANLIQVDLERNDAAQSDDVFSVVAFGELENEENN